MSDYARSGRSTTPRTERGHDLGMRRLARVRRIRGTDTGARHLGFEGQQRAHRTGGGELGRAQLRVNQRGRAAVMIRLFIVAATVGAGRSVFGSVRGPEHSQRAVEQRGHRSARHGELKQQRDDTRLMRARLRGERTEVGEQGLDARGLATRRNQAKSNANIVNY